MKKLRKINGHTVRGGWSSNVVYGKVNNIKFSIWIKDSYITNISIVRYIVKKIEEGKIELPKPINNQNLYYLMPDKSIVAFS